MAPRRLVVVAFLGAAITAAGAQQPPAPPPPTALIVGQTVDGTTGKPVAGAIVSLGRAAAPAGGVAPPAAAGLPIGPSRIISDRDGRFVFHSLAAGSYTLTASKPGYSDGAYGRRSPAGAIGVASIAAQALTLANGDQKGDVKLSLWKHATLGGTVLDEAGEPVIGIQVRVLRRAVVGGLVKFSSFGNMPSTDDRGEYRMSELTPGDYVVAVVTTQTTVPTSMLDAWAVANKAGTSQQFQRELDRSRGALRNGSLQMGSGQPVGTWLLQTPYSFGNAGEVVPPPIRDGRVFVYPTVYHPAAASASRATLVTLGPGDERPRIDFQLRPVPSVRISGMLTGADGPSANTTLDLIPAAADEMQRDYDFAAATTMTDATGAFMFLGVTAGQYTIRALKIPARPETPSSFNTVIQTGSSTITSGGGPSTPPPIPNEPTWWANVPVSVSDTDVPDVAVVFRQGARVSGHLEFEGATQKPAQDRMMQASVTLDPADGRTKSSNQFTLGRGVIDATGAFNTYQLPAGRYVVRGLAFPGWSFKGAFLGGRDVSDAPLEISGENIADVVVVYTDRPTELSGTTRDDRGPDGTATVLVFPAVPAMWSDHGPTPRRFKAVRPGTDGVYRLPGLPAGDYVAIALRSEVPQDWQEQKYLQKVSALASRVTIADGEKKTLDLQTKEVK